MHSCNTPKYSLLAAGMCEVCATGPQVVSSNSNFEISQIWQQGVTLQSPPVCLTGFPED